MEHKLITNKLGFKQLKNKPSINTIKKYYEKIYFQKNKAFYKKKYSKEENDYIHSKINQKFHLINSFLKYRKKMSFLDIGCGNGFVLNFFLKKKWNVTGIDFSEIGIQNIHPKLRSKVLIGDLNQILNKLNQKKLKFDLIWLGNVLEHVLEPIELMKLMKKIINKNGLTCITVPNDDSSFQKFLISNKFVDKKYWIAYPDHISYFNHNNFKNLLKHTGWKLLTQVSDFPIELFLTNKNSNYILDKKNGKLAHNSRLKIEKLLIKNFSTKSVNSFYESLAQVGLGRNITFISKSL